MSVQEVETRNEEQVMRRNKELRRIYNRAGSELPMFLPFDVQQDPNGQTAASVPVRWCITPALMAELQLRHWGNPHVVFVIRSVNTIDFGDNPVQEPHDTDIKVVALKKEMTYLHFTRPGMNQICAVVVNIWNSNSSKMLHDLRNRYAGSWRSCLNDRGIPWDTDNFPGFVLAAGQTQTIEVPREFFAKEPPAWAKQLVKIFFRTKEEDQCHFRRRMILSSLAAAVVVPIVTIVKFIALAFGLLFGLRKMQPETLLQPLNLRPIAPIDYAETPIWWYKQDNEPRDPFLWPWNPPVFLLVFGALFCLQLSPVLPDMSLAMLALWSLAGLVVLDVLILVLGLILVSIDKTRTALDQPPRKKESTAQRQRAKQAAERKQLLEELDAMVCSAGSVKTVSLDALPKEKQTISLRFSALKTKVCRPYAR